jgi:hypothetical protein
MVCEWLGLEGRNGKKEIHRGDYDHHAEADTESEDFQTVKQWLTVALWLIG